MGAMERLPIYAKVKIVEGENFVTIEDTKNLAEDEMIEFAHHFIDDLALTNIRSMNVLVNSKFSNHVDRLLKQHGFQLHDHVVMVRRQLYDLTGRERFPFTFHSLHELSLDEFTSVWQQAANAPLNASSSVINVEEQLQDVMKELGPGYQDTCQAVYENERPIGVVMPHIEPGTHDEGRLFYFGLIPKERGKGKGKPLHWHALQVLKEDFRASYYIGSTSEENIPMMQTFKASGCRVTERNRVFTRKRSE